MSDGLGENLKQALNRRMAEESYDPFVRVEFINQDGAREVRVTGSRDGLLYLASECLRVADSESDWEHAHLDAGNIADPDGCSLVITSEKSNS